MAGLNVTGVILRNRLDGQEYGMHEDCADLFLADIARMIGADPLALGDDMPAVIIGPLFADTSEWRCAYKGCTHTNDKEGK
jgi:hypothetical protein